MAQYSVIAGRIECSRAAIDKLIDLLQLMPAGLLDGLRSFVSLSPKLLLMIIRHDVMRCYEIVLLCLWYLDNVTCLSFVSLLWWYSFRPSPQWIIDVTDCSNRPISFRFFFFARHTRRFLIKFGISHNHMTHVNWSNKKLLLYYYS